MCFFWVLRWFCLLAEGSNTAHQPRWWPGTTFFVARHCPLDSEQSNWVGGGALSDFSPLLLNQPQQQKRRTADLQKNLSSTGEIKMEIQPACECVPPFHPAHQNCLPERAVGETGGLIRMLSLPGVFTGYTSSMGRKESGEASTMSSSKAQGMVQGRHTCQTWPELLA